MASEQMLLQDNNGKTIQAVGNYFMSGSKTLGASIPEKLLPDGTPTLKIILKGKTGNTANILIGGPDVNSNSFYLDADQSVELEVDNSKFPVYVMATTANDVVTYIAITGRLLT